VFLLEVLGENLTWAFRILKPPKQDNTFPPLVAFTSSIPPATLVPLYHAAEQPWVPGIRTWTPLRGHCSSKHSNVLVI
jgi:hypothetical protein